MITSTEDTRTARSGSVLTTIAGWLTVAFGAVHLTVSSYGVRDGWSHAVDDGWWNSVTLETATTLAEFERSETFWVSLGSFGAPMLILGCYIVWATRQGQRVPGWLGWMVLLWGLILISALTASPGWFLPVIGGLLILGDRGRG